MIITRKMVDAMELHSFVAEASSLGWPPGKWPRTVETTLGNGLPFLLWSINDGEAIYRQSNGIIVLRVLND